MKRLEPAVNGIVATSGGQRLFVGEWPGEDPPFVFAPGLTSTHRGIAAVARELDGLVRVIGIDLRGRGNSSKPPAGSYGMEAHARDVLDVMDALGIERAIVGGHSMGAYVATAAAVAAPERVLGLILIDGGVLLAPAGVEIDPDELLERAIGPAMQRLRMTFGSVEAYFDFFRDTPFWAEAWGEVAEDYLRYDLGFAKGGHASKCSEVAAAEDWRDLLVNPRTAARLQDVECPVLAVAAEHGMERGQPSVLSDGHIAALRDRVGELDMVRVPSSTHHSVIVSEAGAAVAAEAIAAFARRLVAVR